MMNPKQMSVPINVALNDDQLTLENNAIQLTFRWNQGNLIRKKIKAKTTGFSWKLAATKPDFDLPCLAPATRGDWYPKFVSETPIAPAHLDVATVALPPDAKFAD